MHKIFPVSCVILLLAVQIYAADTPFEKLQRGGVSVLTAPIEMIKETRAYWIEGSAKTYHISAWLFCGAMKGIVMTAARAGSGVWDIVTFAVPVPKGYSPLLKPDSVFDEWPKREPGVKYKNLGDE